MNKAKIMLSAVAAIAAVGGAFALKSKKVSGIPLYKPSVFRTTGIYGTVQYCDTYLGTGQKLAGTGNYYVTITNPSLCNFSAYVLTEE